MGKHHIGQVGGDIRTRCDRHTSGPNTTSCLRSAFVKYPRRFDGLSFTFPPFPFALFVRSCVVSSPMGSFGGNGGGVAPGSMRLCWKYGMVAMSGDRAHGFELDARSCSSVGSMKLGGGVRSGSGDVRGNKVRTS